MRKTIKPIYLTLILTLLTLTSFTQTLHTGGQAQPQFKFWLAFEDSIGQRDTLWVIIDSTTTSSFLDSAWGEIPIINPDSGKFLTYFQYSIDKKKDTTKVYTAATYEKGVSIWIGAVNYHLPITVRWDSSLLRNNGLPWEISASALYNYFTAYAGLNYINPDGYFQMEFTDSILLPKFNWFTKNHFPLQLYLADKPLFVGINNEPNNFYIKPSIWPNPASNTVFVNSNEKIENIQLININGIIESTFYVMQTNSVKIPISGKPGLYFLKIQTVNQTYFEKLIIRR